MLLESSYSEIITLHQLRKLVTNVPGVIYQFRLEPDGTTSFPYVSDGCREILSIEPDDVQQDGTLLIEAVHPDDKKLFFESVAISAQTLQRWDWEGKMITPFGKIKWIRGISRPELQADGAIVWDGLLIDVSEQHEALNELKQTQLALQQAKNELEIKVEDIKFALDEAAIVAITNSKGIIEYVNDKFCEISQYDRTEIIGNTHSLINSKYHPPTFFQEMWKTIATGKVWKGEIQNRAKDGTFYWVNTTIVPFLDMQGKPQQYIAIRSDITVRKAAEVNLEQAFKELQRTQCQLIQSEKMSSLGQLVAGVAHEINNPVNFIYGNLDHAEQYTYDLLNILTLYHKYYPEPVAQIKQQAEEIDFEFLLEDLSKLYKSMKLGATRIREIVTSLRTFSRLDEAEYKEADIHEGINSTLMILEHRLKAKPNRPEITVIKEYGEIPLITCSAGQLNQVFMNILANAIDAVEERVGKIPFYSPSIRICTEISASNQAVIRIADNGVGMCEEVRSRLFDPFYTTKPVGKGTGMGLSISYQIVTERHCGSLECTSKPGEGSEFIITLSRMETSA